MDRPYNKHGKVYFQPVTEGLITEASAAVAWNGFSFGESEDLEDSKDEKYIIPNFKDLNFKVEFESKDTSAFDMLMDIVKKQEKENLFSAVEEALKTNQGLLIVRLAYSTMYFLSPKSPGEVYRWDVPEMTEQQFMREYFPHLADSYFRDSHGVRPLIGIDETTSYRTYGVSDL